MKRKLRQWLLDATNKSDKSANPSSIRKTSKQLSLNDSYNNENDRSEEHNSSPGKATPDQIPNSTINIVPIANLLSPSRGGIPTIDYSIHTPDTNVEMNERLESTQSSSSIATIPTNELQPVIKTEKIDEIEPSTSNTTTTVNNQQVVIKQEIKDEPATNDPAVNVKVESVEVKPERPSCNYGIKCFRRNPSHRIEMAHPGDADYRRPTFPEAPPGTPPCPWGAACYRRNRQHFMHLSHPPATNTTSTTMNVNANTNAMQQSHTSRSCRGNRRVVNNADPDEEEDDYDLEDPFIDDGSSDEYVPDGVDDETDDVDDTQESSIT